MRLTPLNSWGMSDGRKSAFRDFGIPHASFRTYLVLLVIIFICVGVAARFGSARSAPILTTALKIADGLDSPRPPADAYVLLARQRIMKGTQLKPFMFSIGHAPSGWVPKDSISDIGELAGLQAAVNIPAKFPLVREYVSGTQGNPVSRKVPEGYRAVSITTSLTNSVEGWARAGAHVDVQWIGPLEGKLYSKVMAENLEVLSAERRTEPAQTSTAAAPATITLLASTEDADKIGLVSGVGEIVLHLRGSEDNATSGDSGILKDDDLFAKREVSIDDRVQGVARIKTGNDSKTWALIDGKWGERSKKK